MCSGSQVKCLCSATAPHPGRPHVCCFHQFVCSPQASVLENLRLAVRSQLGFTSLRLPASSRNATLWRRLFTFSRSRRSGSLALVSADLEDSAGSGSTGSSASDLLSPDSETDTDTEGERGRERGVGAVGGAVAPLPHKAPPPSSAVEAAPTTATPTTPIPSRNRGPGDGSRETPPPPSPVAVPSANRDPECHSDAASELQAPPSSALQRLASGLQRLARNLTRTSQNQQNRVWTNHSPLRQLEAGRHGADSPERRGSGDDEEDVELLIPSSDSDSASSSLVDDIQQPLLEPHPSAPVGRSHHHHSRRSRNGPCEHCGMVHTAQIPDACLWATTKTESREQSDDELLLLC